MRSRQALIVLVLCLGLPAVAAPADGRGDAPGPALQELALAERAFARASIERGMRDAFLEFLAEDSVIFRPGPVAGREWFDALPAIEGRLSWEPQYVDVASSGDFGYTTGPWQFVPGGDGEPSWGHYVSVWRKSDDETWQVVLDIGTSHARPESGTGELEFADRRPPRANRAAERGDERAGVSLADTDAAYRELAAGEGGSTAACESFAGARIRLYRDRRIPIAGKHSACPALDELEERLAPGETVAVVPPSDDLGYTYGTLRVHGGQAAEGSGAAGSFLRIWRRDDDGAWKLVLDLVAPGGPD